MTVAGVGYSAHDRSSRSAPHRRNRVVRVGDLLADVDQFDALDSTEVDSVSGPEYPHADAAFGSIANAGLKYVEAFLNSETVERDRGPAEVQLLARRRQPVHAGPALGDDLPAGIVAAGGADPMRQPG